MSTSLSTFPKLEQLKKQAKDLRKAHDAGSAEAASRLRAYVRRLSDLDDDEILKTNLILRDAQHVVAREHGFSGWQDLLGGLEAKDARTPRSLVEESADYADDELLPVQIMQAEVLERSNGSKSAAVVLRGETDRIIVIVISEEAGQSLSMLMRGQRVPRPLTYDLFTACLALLKGTVCTVVIHSLSEGVFLAHVMLDVEGKRVCLDARPSDCLNLAARQSAPIYVTPALMKEAGRPMSDLPSQFEMIRTMAPQ